jgi:hypothetical protein
VGGEEQLERFLVREALPRVAARADATGAHLLVADQAASAMVPVERQGRPTVIPNWIVVIEGVSLDAVNVACDAELPAERLRDRGCAEVTARDTYCLQIMVSRPETSHVGPVTSP